MQSLESNIPENGQVFFQMGFCHAWDTGGGLGNYSRADNPYEKGSMEWKLFYLGFSSGCSDVAKHREDIGG